MTRLRHISSGCALVILVAGAQAGCFHDTALSTRDADQSHGTGGAAGPVVDDAAVKDAIDAAGSHLRIAFSRNGARGDFGGHVAADYICQNGADYGIWHAWVSDDSSNAIDRIKSDGPWYTMDGHLAFASKAQLTQTPSAVIQYDQGGALVAASSYWTGTALGGDGTTPNCNNWTTAADDLSGTWGDGRQLQGAETWTAAPTAASCANALNLLCIED